MKYKDIKRYFKPYGIVAHRKSTINNAFASAIAPHDEFEDTHVRDAITRLGQDPDNDLMCVYCEAVAQTWDHVFGTVQDGVFSGYGHRLGNLLPCCKSCNSAKGKKNWNEFLNSKVNLSKEDKRARTEIIKKYLTQYPVSDVVTECDQYRELLTIKDQILELMKKADDIAIKLRATRT